METCFATVIYKNAEEYLEEFLNSINNQIDKKFDLLLFNDNYTDEELAGIQKKTSSLDIFCRIIDISDLHLSIAGNRIEMLACAKDLGYDLAILGDADDTFSTNRVAAYKKAYELDKSSVFFYNNLVKDDGQKVFQSIPKKIDSVKPISQENFLGLSTAGVRLSSLSMDFIDSLKEGETPAFDWYLFTRILMDIGGGTYVDDADTIYRIYDNNTVGVTRNINQEYAVKQKHYEALAKRYKYFEDLLSKLNQLDLDKINANPNHLGYWWSDIQMEDS